MFIRLAGWFLAIALVPLAIAGVAAYVTYRETLMTAAEGALEGIAAARARQIESEMKERRREVAALAAHPLLAATLAAAGPGSDARRAGAGADESLRELVQLYLTRQDYADLVLLSAAGDIVLDARVPADEARNVRLPPYRGTPLDRVFDAALRGGGTEVSPVGKGPFSDRMTAYIAAPVSGRDGAVAGVLALEIDWASVARVLAPRAGLGQTGETYLAARDGDRIVLTTPLRFLPKRATARTLRLGSPVATAIQSAVLGERGQGFGIDYRGVEVLAAWRPLPALGWGLVVEVDVWEALRPLKRLRRGLLLLGTVTVLIAGAAALWVARSFARPVVELTRISERFAAGDLGARTSATAHASRDEIGGLARAFDAMADSLEESRARLEETIAALRAKNDALEESESRFRQLAASVDVAFWILELGEPERYLYMSPAWQRITGAESLDLARDIHTFWDVHPEDVGVIERAWPELLETGHGEAEFRLRRADGSVRWVRSRASVLPGEPGRPTRIAGITEDIDDRRAAAAALQASEEMFRRLAEATRLVPWKADGASYRFTYVGPQAVDLLGFPLDGWLQPGFWESRIHPDERARVVSECHRLCAERDHYELDYRMIAADGRTVWVHDLVSVARGEGRPVSLSGFLIDITERKRAEAEREELLASARAAQQAAEEASRLKDEFLATVSHELRTPLNAILGWSQVLDGDDVDEETRTRAIATIARNARSQARLIDDLLDISRIITGRLRLETRPVADLGAIVDAATGSLRLAADAKQIRLCLSLEPRVGPILGDPMRLQQVVWNLVSNAIKFTPSGGEVRIALERVGDRARLVVSDSGEGIRPDFLPYVFDRFRQGDGGSTRLHGGLGLGLAIVRQLVELHGGRAQVVSEGVGRGATFTVTLPIMASHLPEREPRRPRAEGGAADAAATLDGVRVLAVDDEPDSLDLVRAILERCRARVETVSTAAEALRRVLEDPPQVLVADIAMPEHDGLWLIREVRALDTEHGGDVPAVALTAYARPEERAALLAAGYHRHLPKPITAEQLTQAIADLARPRVSEEPAEQPPPTPA